MNTVEQRLKWNVFATKINNKGRRDPPGFRKENKMVRKSYPIKLNEEEVAAITKNGKYKLPEGLRNMIRDVELLESKLKVCELELEKAQRKE